MKRACLLCVAVAVVVAACRPSSKTETKVQIPTNTPPTAVEFRDKEGGEYRLQWNRDTLARDYERYGRRSPKWDASAKAALEAFAEARVSRQEALEGLNKRLAATTKEAIAKGCDDPMLRYLYIRFGMASEKPTNAQYTEAYRSTAQELSQSKYAPIRKFYAAERAADALASQSKPAPPAASEWRQKASEFLAEAVKDKAMPVAEVYEAARDLLRSVKNAKPQLGNYYRALEPALFQNWPSASDVYLLKGEYCLDYAWQARGSGYGNTVNEVGWQLFAQRLREADKALAKAWEMNPQDERIARAMLTVELGQGNGRDRMEEWFERAMNLNTNYYDACWSKLYYLEPKWYGSRQDMLDFGHECLESDKWGGRVPLILVDAHDELAKTLNADARLDYWKDPEVWSDVKGAYDKFFKANPDAIGFHHNYARFAYWAEQWDELNRQLPLLGEVNYEYFGGQEEFDKMVRLAKDHAAKSK